MPPSSSSWTCPLDVSLRAQSSEVVSVLATRLTQPSLLRKIRHQLPKLHWQESALAAGFPSLALLFGELASQTGEHSWLDLAERMVIGASEATQRRPLQTPSLGTGTAGLALVLSCLAQQEPRFHRASRQIGEQLARQARQTSWITRAPYLGTREMVQYDVLRGASGTLAALLQVPSPEAEVQEAITTLLRVLVTFVATPRLWALPASCFPAQRQRYQGTWLINCGLAHGLPGPLATLSLARLAGFEVGGQVEAIQTLAAWLAARHLSTTWGIDWPAVIPERASLEAIGGLPPARTGWCYGTPGLARALWLAGQVLDDPALQTLALQGIQAVLGRPAALRQIDAVTLCHGTPGFLLIALRFYQETADPQIGQQLPFLVQQILQAFQPDLPLGFRYPAQGIAALHAVGLFLGVTGTLLALLAATSEQEPCWDRALLLA